MQPWSDKRFVECRERCLKSLDGYVEATRCEFELVQTLKKEWAKHILATSDKEWIRADLDNLTAKRLQKEYDYYCGKAGNIFQFEGMIHCFGIGGLVGVCEDTDRFDSPDEARSHRLAFIDWLSSASSVASRRDPVVMKAFLKAVDEGGSFCTPYFLPETLVEAAKLLTAHYPGDWIANFQTDGGLGNETALKYALAYAEKTGHSSRNLVACFAGTYHANSGLGAKLTAFGVCKNWGRAIPDQHVFDQPDTDEEIASFMEKLKELCNKDVLAAFLVEAIPGDRGMPIPPTKLFKQMLNLLWDQHRIPLIFDEVQSGFGRTGKWLGFEHHDLVPPMFTFGKSAGNGLCPVSGVVLRKELDALPPPAALCTYGGGRHAMALLCCMYRFTSDKNFLAAVKHKGELLHGYFQQVVDFWSKHKNHSRLFVKIKGIGLMSGLELRWAEANPMLDLAPAAVQWLLRRGVIAGAVGSCTLRLHPSLTVEDVEIHALGKMLLTMVEQLLDGSFDQDLLDKTLNQDIFAGLCR